MINTQARDAPVARRSGSALEREVRRRWWARVGKMRADLLATGLGVEKRKRESARPAARGPTAKRENGCWFWAANGTV
jgi:hypothetical protein